MGAIKQGWSRMAKGAQIRTGSALSAGNGGAAGGWRPDQGGRQNELRGLRWLDQEQAEARLEINRCGNRIVRWTLVEMIWRLAKWQPDYQPVRLPAKGLIQSSRPKKRLAVK